MSPRRTGCTILVFALLAAAQRWARLQIPVLKVPFLAGNIAGYILCALVFAAGLWLMLKGAPAWNLSPLTQKKLQRFRAIRRGYVSFLVFLVLTGVASLDTLLVGKRALFVNYAGRWYLPFIHEVIPGKTFGLDYDGETDYRDLQEKFRTAAKGNWVLMPPVPFAPSLDTPQIIETLEAREGKLFPPASSKP